MIDKLHLPSPAKINLFLHVVGRRADGYHLLQTAFQFIDFCDDMSFALRTDGKITLDCPHLDVEFDDNLIVKAAKLIKEHSHSPLGVDIQITKKIPLGGGLGGGSSNAATTLLALRQLWSLNLSQTELAKLGLQLGADVPIFIHGESAFAEGVGEHLQPITLPEDWILLLLPSCTSETRKIFSDSQLTRNTPQITIAEFLENGGHNDCEPVARKLFPEIANALDYLNHYTKARLTGTGSGVFATFKTKEAALKVAENIPTSLNRIIIKGLNISPLHNTIRNVMLSS